MKWKAEVKIMPKKGIRDPQGEAVSSALKSLGYENAADVRIGKMVEFIIETDNEDNAGVQVEEACKRLLANPVIEDYSFTLNKI